MSFITKDKNLANLLAYHGLSKRAQQYAGISPQDFGAVRGIISNLEKQLASPTSTVISGAQVGTESDQAASLSSINMENIGSLVEFLARNQITVDGKRIAYAANENPNDAAYSLYKLQGSAGLLELANRGETVQYGYYINKALLVDYLNTLRGQLAKNPNPVLNAQLGALINQANEELDANMSGDYKENKSLPTNQPLDSVPQNIKTSDPTSPGSIVLTYGDITADTNFNAWIQKNNVSVDGRAYQHLQYDKCGLVKVLLIRATSYVSNATSVDDKEKFTIYQEIVQKLAADIKCDLNDNKSNTNNETDSANQTGGANVAVQTSSLQELIDVLPLQMDQLDFGRIRDFVSHYRSVVLASTDANRSGQAETAMQQLEQYMQAATQNTVGGSLTNFHMDGLTANDLVSWAVPPTQPGEQTRSRGSARALADYLEYVVRNVYTLVKDLYNSKYAQLANMPQLRQAIEQQVGGRSIPYGSSIANSNIEDIRAARARLPQVGA